jgi:ubiquinone biosynthesis protein UbiJ
MNSAADIAIERLLERVVAQARADSPRAAALLAELTGRKLGLQVLGTPLSFVLESDGQRLHLHPSGAADASIIGAPLSLLALAGEDTQAVISRGDARIEGDAQIAQQFRELGMLLRPDLEAGLSRLFGRSAAHIAMLGLRSARDWAQATAWTGTQNLAEYLAHERQDLVSRFEAEHFLRAVDQLREQTDRLDARLQQLEDRTKS